MKKDDFGLRLKEERQRLQMTQTELAAVGGVQKQAQLLYEKGERKPDVAYLHAVSDRGVDVLYVVTAHRSPALLSPEEELLLSGYRSLDTKGRAGVLGLIGGMTRPEGVHTTMSFKGPVGQQIQGDVTYTGSVDLKVGGVKKKNK